MEDSYIVIGIVVGAMTLMLMLDDLLIDYCYDIGLPTNSKRIGNVVWIIMLCVIVFLIIKNFI